MAFSVRVFPFADPAAKYLGIEHGLSNNFVTAVFQDSHGFMWFGTYDGLNRFDGYDFKVFKNQPESKVSLPDNRITAIIEDKRGTVWTATKRGAAAFDSKDGRFFRLRYRSPANGEIHDISSAISALVCLPDGNFFAASEKIGLLYIPFKSNQRDVATRIPYVYTNGQLTDYNILAMACDTTGKLWMMIHGIGLCYYDQVQQAVRLATNAMQAASCMRADRDGNLWLGNGGGLFRYSPNDNRFRHYATESGLSGNMVVALNIDSKGRIWACTNGDGITILDPAIDQMTYLTSKSNGGTLNSDAVFAAHEDAEGRQWVGTLRGGINVIDPNTGHFRLVRQRIRHPELEQLDYILSFEEDRDGSVWIGTDGAGLIHWNRKDNHFERYRYQEGIPNTLSNNFVTSILRDQSNHLWVATYGGGINRFDRETGTFRRYACSDTQGGYENAMVWKLYEDKHGQIWATTVGDGGVYRLDRSSDRFELYDASLKNVLSIQQENQDVFWMGTYTELIRVDVRQRTENRHLIGNSVRFIHQGRNDSLWVGTEGGGLLRFDKTSGDFLRFTESSGLPSNTMLNLLQDSRGHYWLSTYNGIAKFDPKTNDVKSYYESDGLQSNQFSYNAALRLRTGEFLFGGIKGFNTFFPDSIRFSYASPKIVLTDLRINNKPFTGESSSIASGRSLLDVDRLRIPFDEAVVSVSFAALEYSSPTKINYAYLLEGWDKDWNYVDNQRTAHYSRLNEGKYTLRIKATNADGEWLAAERRVSLTVLPPWWRSPWAYATYALLIFGAIGAYVIYDRRQTKLKYEVELAHMEVEKEKELNERKLSFFTHISHEFRTPLTLIVNPVKELLYSENKMIDSEELHGVYRNSKRLLGLVDQLLLFRKADSGQDRLRVVLLNIVTLCNEVFLCFKQHAASRKIDYRFECAIEKLEAYADREKIEIVLFNLISNALKFTPAHGTVTVGLTADHDSIRIQVTDTGCGIPKKTGDSLFNKFYRGSDFNGNVAGGFGIGLFLVKNFVEAHGGNVSYVSAENQGTRFTVSLRKGKAHLEGLYVFEDLGEQSTFLEELIPQREDIGPTPQVSPQEAIQDITDWVSDKPVLLVIDDNSEIRQYIQRIFADQYLIHQSDTGEEGMGLLKKLQPDIVLCDVVMKGLSGIDLCTQVKQDPALNHIPIILLTASSSDEVKIKGIECGADDYITKPFDKELLIARVNGMLRTRNQLQQYFYNEITLKSNDFKISSAYSEFLNKCMDTVERHLDNPEFNVKTLADEVGMSYSSLYKKIKSISGKSANEFIRFIRLRKSAQLLITTDLGVSEAAYATGFNDIKYFREQFSKLFDMKPSEYRKKYRNAFQQHYKLKKS